MSVCKVGCEFDGLTVDGLLFGEASRVLTEQNSEIIVDDGKLRIDLDGFAEKLFGLCMMLRRLAEQQAELVVSVSCVGVSFDGLAEGCFLFGLPRRVSTEQQAELVVGNR